MDISVDRWTLIFILQKPIGLISLLNEESNSLTATDLTFVCKLKQHIKSSPCFKSEREEFCIRHYAGEVSFSYKCILSSSVQFLRILLVFSLFWLRDLIAFTSPWSDLRSIVGRVFLSYHGFITVTILVAPSLFWLLFWWHYACFHLLPMGVCLLTSDPLAVPPLLAILLTSH